MTVQELTVPESIAPAQLRFSVLRSFKIGSFHIGSSLTLSLIHILVGLGLSWLLGAPLRYIMLNEAPRPQRAAAQGALALSTRVGQLVGGALVGAVAASHGGGTAGYQQAFLGVGVITLMCFFAAFGLKNRSAELATVQRNEAQATAEAPQPQPQLLPGT